MNNRYEFLDTLGISKKVIAVGECSTSDEPIRKKPKVDLEVNCPKTIMKELLDKCVSETSLTEQEITTILRLCNEYDDFRKALCEQSLFRDGEKISPIYRITEKSLRAGHIPTVLDLCTKHDDLRKAICEQSVFSDGGKISPIYWLIVKSSSKKLITLLRLCNKYDDLRKAICEQSVFGDGAKISPIYLIIKNEELYFNHTSQILELIESSNVVQTGVSQLVTLKTGSNSSALFKICEIISNPRYKNWSEAEELKIFIKDKILTKWPVFKELASFYDIFRTEALKDAPWGSTGDRFDTNYSWVVSFYKENKPLLTIFDSYGRFNLRAAQSNEDPSSFSRHIFDIKDSVFNHLDNNRSIDLLIDCLNTMMKKPEELEIKVGNEHLIWASIQALLNDVQETQNKSMETKLKKLINGLKITKEVLDKCFDSSRKFDVISQKFNALLTEINARTCNDGEIAPPKVMAKRRRLINDWTEDRAEMLRKWMGPIWVSPMGKLPEVICREIADYT